VNLGGRMLTGPITYELDGRQYLLMPAGGLIFAWVIGK
jgi:hypothetical protein